MGLYDRDYARDNSTEWSLGAETMVVRLIVITTAVFLIQVLFDGADGSVTNLLSLQPGNLLQPWYWWRLVTYGFAHAPNDIGHLVINMFCLWLFGRDVESIYGKREFAAFYLTALILGGIAWSARHLHPIAPANADPELLATLHSSAGVLGASGAVMAVLMLFVLHYPFRNIYFFLVVPVPAWLLAAMYVIGDLAGFQRAQAGGWSGVAYEVHLAGAAFAAIYWKLGLRMSTLLPTNWRSSWSRRERFSTSRCTIRPTA
jgi:membrane associated rhomboid family serine protease